MKKVVLINIIIFFSLLISIELLSRVYISYKTGIHSAGLTERNQNLRYQPFVMYGPIWKEKIKNFKKVKKENNFNILLIGGSTAEAFPPNILKVELEKKIKKDVNIVNFATGGYISTQELIILALYLEKIQPNIVINLNGANDITHSLREGNLVDTFYLNNTYENILTKPYLGPFIFLLQRSQFYNGVQRIFARKKNYKTDIYEPHIDRYLQNIKSMKALCDGLNIDYYLFLQPHVEFKKKHKNEINFKHYDYRKKIVKELYEIADFKIRNISNLTYVNTNDYFAENSKHIFSDDVHFIDNEGYKILSKIISFHIK